MNNRQTAGRIQLIFTLAILVLMALLVCSVTVKLFMLAWLQWLAGALFVAVMYGFMYGGYYYFEIAKRDHHIEIKFYNIFPFTREFKMFRIPVSAFVKYEMEGAVHFRRRMYLFQRSANQMAKYPPIFVSAFSRKDNEDLQVFFASLKGRVSRGAK